MLPTPSFELLQFQPYSWQTCAEAGQKPAQGWINSHVPTYFRVFQDEYLHLYFLWPWSCWNPCQDFHKCTLNWDDKDLGRRFIPFRSPVGRSLQTVCNHFPLKFWALSAEMGRNNNRRTARCCNELCQIFQRNCAKTWKFKEGSVLQQCEFVNKVLFHGVFLFR